jgi:pilus assembly protein FimV
VSALQRVAAAMLCLLPTTLAALGVGDMEVSSGLNQPLDAKIPIVGARQGELADVSARLAEDKAFARAGLERPHALSALQFQVVPTDETSGYIHVTSRGAIREPAMEFIVEVEWRGGSLRRKYSVLLEPR